MKYYGIVGSQDRRPNWYAKIYQPDRSIRYIGPFPDPEDAARAFDDHRRMLGCWHKLNFPRPDEPGRKWKKNKKELGES